MLELDELSSAAVELDELLLDVSLAAVEDEDDELVTLASVELLDDEDVTLAAVELDEDVTLAAVDEDDEDELELDEELLS